MRIVSMALALSAVGCTQPLGLSHLSSLTHDTRGVAIADGGVGAAGMNAMVCGFDLTLGTVFNDWRTDDSDEHVLDQRAGRVLAAAPTGLWEIDLGTRNWNAVTGGEAQLSDAADVVAAGWLYEEGAATVVVAGDDTACRVEISDDVQQTYDVDPALCDAPSVAFDRASGTAWVAGGTLFRVDASGATDTGVRADLVAWDRVRDVLLVAEAGEPEVTALDPAGSEVYTVDTGNPVVSVATLGRSSEEAIVMTAPANGVGRVVVMTADTGDIVQTVDMPQPGDLVVNPAGTFVGIVAPTQVHFYSVGFDVPLTALMQPAPQAEMFD